MKANEFVKNKGINAARVHLEIMDAEGWCNFFYENLKRLVESHELVESYGGLDRLKKALNGKHIGYTHFYLHSNGRYVFLDHYNDFIPEQASHIGMFNKAIADVESCQ